MAPIYKSFPEFMYRSPSISSQHTSFQHTGYAAECREILWEHLHDQKPCYPRKKIFLILKFTIKQLKIVFG